MSCPPGSVSRYGPVRQIGGGMCSSSPSSEGHSLEEQAPRQASTRIPIHSDHRRPLGGSVVSQQSVVLCLGQILQSFSLQLGSALAVCVLVCQSRRQNPDQNPDTASPFTRPGSIQVQGQQEHSALVYPYSRPQDSGSGRQQRLVMNRK